MDENKFLNILNSRRMENPSGDFSSRIIDAAAHLKQNKKQSINIAIVSLFKNYVSLRVAALCFTSIFAIGIAIGFSNSYDMQSTEPSYISNIVPDLLADDNFL